VGFGTEVFKMKEFLISFLMQFIPMQYIWIVLGIFVIVLISLIYFLSKYIKYHIILAVLIVVFVLGYAHFEIEKVKKDCQYNTKVLAEELIRMDNESNKVTERIVIKYKEKIKIIKERDNTIAESVKKQITDKENSECKIPKSFIDLHNNFIQKR
jgi:hypothetical protein